jgi:hypothetical protein
LSTIQTQHRITHAAVSRPGVGTIGVLAGRPPGATGFVVVNPFLVASMDAL